MKNNYIKLINEWNSNLCHCQSIYYYSISKKDNIIKDTLKVNPVKELAGHP